MIQKKLPRPMEADMIKREKVVRQHGNNSDEYLAILNRFNWSTQIYKEKELYGLKTAWGEELLEASYENFRLLPTEELQKGDRVVAQLNGMWGVLIIDGHGSWLIEPEYDDIGYPNPLIHVRKGDKWGVLNIEKKDFVLPLGYGEIHIESGFMFSNGIGVYEKDGKFGVIVDDGTFTEATFDKVDDEPFGFVKVRINGKWGFINKDGQYTQNKDEAATIYKYKE